MIASQTFFLMSIQGASSALSGLDTAYNPRNPAASSWLLRWRCENHGTLVVTNGIYSLAGAKQCRCPRMSEANIFSPVASYDISSVGHGPGFFARNKLDSEEGFVVGILENRTRADLNGFCQLAFEVYGVSWQQSSRTVTQAEKSAILTWDETTHLVNVESGSYRHFQIYRPGFIAPGVNSGCIEDAIFTSNVQETAIFEQWGRDGFFCRQCPLPVPVLKPQAIKPTLGRRKIKVVRVAGPACRGRV